MAEAAEALAALAQAATASPRVARAIGDWRAVIQLELDGEPFPLHALVAAGRLELRAGRHPRPTLVLSGCALRAAYAEVAAGLSGVVLLLGIQKSGDLINPRSGHRGEGTMMSESITHDVNWQHPYTPFPPAAWGLILTAHMHRWGTPTP